MARHIGDHTYGVDIVIPNKYEGMDSDLSADELTKTLQDMAPQEHVDFARKILSDHGVPIEGSGADAFQLLGWTEATAIPQVEVALQHPKVTLIANALGTPPPDMIKHIHDEGRRVAALCGSPSQARKHADAGVDIIIARAARRAATAARSVRSCCGHRSSRRSPRFRCWPRAASAAASRSQRRWRLALRVHGPAPLGMPLQYMVSGMAVAATHNYPNESVDVAFNPVGQVVGQLTKVEKSAAVIQRWVQEYLEATNRLDELNEAATV